MGRVHGVMSESYLTLSYQFLVRSYAQSKSDKELGCPPKQSGIGDASDSPRIWEERIIALLYLPSSVLSLLKVEGWRSHGVAKPEVNGRPRYDHRESHAADEQ